LLHDAEEGTTRVFKYNEVVSLAIPPGISPRSQSDQALNFGRLVRGIEVEMKPTPAPWTPSAQSRYPRRVPANGCSPPDSADPDCLGGRRLRGRYCRQMTLARMTVIGR